MNFTQSVVLAIVLTVVAFYLQWRRSWQQKQARSQLPKIFFVSCVIGGVTFGAAHAVEAYQINEKIDASFAEIVEAPLLGTVVKDHPEYTTQIREAVRADIESSVTTSERRLAVITKIREEYIIPTYWSASDGAIAELASTRLKALKYLRDRDPQFCGQWVRGTNVDFEKFGNDVRLLVYKFVTAAETVYREGRNRAGVPNPLTDDNKRVFWQIVAPSPNEIQAFQGAGTDADLCNLSIKAYETIDRIDDRYRSAVARWLLGGAG